jgi:hypothetical protein
MSRYGVTWCYNAFCGGTVGTLMFALAVLRDVVFIVAFIIAS